ncbi:uncharacterized protein LOC120990789 [Bufo bufo]|uniref:uncharacterized protein LOC120990789 n=1 Tax=Bufo bufo TaxID=8384 RepID=UPI001ABDEA8E|nr:uncharacterized protein LOC120990789 [Bufo bufo]
MGVLMSTVRRKKKDDEHEGVKNLPADLSQMWNRINTLPPVERLHNLSSQYVPSGWITIRVFVSSTFDDFHSEREVLVKQVFPELREWCEARSMCLVECDLRWGIPKDTPSGKIFATCLGELDRCHQDTFGTPFMVVLLGERAGWIPDAAEVPQGIVDLYHWIDGMSVTGTEILHGAYRNYNPNAAFCLRDPSFLLQLSQEDLPKYQDKGHKASFMLSLKEQLCCRFPAEQILHYGCQILATEPTTGQGKVKLGISSEFSSWILEFLKKRILLTFPERSESTSKEVQISWEEAELAQHHIFLHQKQQLFLGRDLEIQRILEFLKMEQDDSAMLENKDVDAEWRIPMYQIVSEPGREQEDVLMKLRNCWRNEEIKDILQHVLQTSAKLPGMATYIFIDAINQLSFPSDVTDLSSWLSTQGFLPPSYKCVISCTPTSALCTISPSTCLNLDLLSPEAAQRLVVLYLSRYSKVTTLV